MRWRVFMSLLAGCVVVGVAACGGSASHARLAADAVTSSSTTQTDQTTPTTTGTQTSRTTTVKKTIHSDRRTTPKSKSAPDPQTTTAASAPEAHTILVKRLRSSAARRVTHEAPSSPLSAASGFQSARVLACLRRGGTGHVSADATGLWTGFESKTGTWVYVYLYPTRGAAAARAHFLAAEEAATAGRYLIQQPVAPYRGSPVPAVTVCLGGKPPKQPTRKPGSFTF